jgi:hypothetical protein
MKFDVIEGGLIINIAWPPGGKLGLYMMRPVQELDRVAS